MMINFNFPLQTGKIQEGYIFMNIFLINMSLHAVGFR
jgi:hypothetical protein